MSPRVTYLRDAKSRPVGCIAIHLLDVDVRTTQASYQVSVLNPADQFDRGIARHLALGRLLEKPRSVNVKRSSGMHAVTGRIMQAIYDDSSMPNRARKAARLWLDTNLGESKHSA